MQISIGGWRIDCLSRTARKDGQTRQLSPRAVRLVGALAEANGATLSRSELMDHIWPDVIVTDESLTQVVSEVRKTLADRSLIGTVARRGYRLAQPVFRSVQMAPPTIGPLRSDTRQDADLGARSLCLEARAEMVRCGPGSMARADALTAEAVELAPDCPVAHADRCVALVRSHMYWSEGCDTLYRAIKMAERAVDLDASCAKAQSALGYALCAGGHWEAAEAAHSRALARDPRDPSCYLYAGWLMMSQRRNREAISFFEQVGDLDSQNIKGYLQAARLSLRHDPARSRQNAERALQRAQNRLSADPTDTRALTATAVLMALMGEPGAAWSAVEDIDVRDSAQAIYNASTYSMIGEFDRALMLFEELFDHGWRDVHWLDADPGFANIATDRRFQRVRRRLAVA